MLDIENDRVVYCDVLKAPDGYLLEKCVGTTYSLDLETMLAVVLSLKRNYENYDDKNISDIDYYLSLDDFSDKVVVFYNYASLYAPNKTNKLFSFLEKMIIPVNLTKDKKNIASFHSKVWLLCFINEQTKKRKYRFAIMSRNLTFDNSLDICLSMDGEETAEKGVRQEALCDFVDYLLSICDTNSKEYDKSKEILLFFQRKFKNVDFRLNDRSVNTDYKIIPMGIYKKEYRKDFFLELLEKKYSSGIDGCVVMSPFISHNMIKELFDNRIFNSKRKILITEKSQLQDYQSFGENVNVYVLKEEVLNSDSDKKLFSHIHAKMYLFQYGNTLDIYLGSMNATTSAMYKNVEMMMRFSVKTSNYNIDQFLQELSMCDLFDGENSLFQLIENPEDFEFDETNESERLLEEKLRQFIGEEIRCEIEQREGSYYMHLNIKCDLRAYRQDCCIRIKPLHLDNSKIVDEVLVFKCDSPAKLSGFFEVTASMGNVFISRLMQVPTNGLPNSVLDSIREETINEDTLVEYLSKRFKVEDDSESNLPREDKEDSDEYVVKIQKEKRIQLDTIQLYEIMLKSALNSPEVFAKVEQDLCSFFKKESSNEFVEKVKEFFKTFKGALGKVKNGKI